MKTIYETYSEEVCRVCKNKKDCKEELVRRVDRSIKCDKYEFNSDYCMKRKCNKCKNKEKCFKERNNE